MTDKITIKVAPTNGVEETVKHESDRSSASSSDDDLNDRVRRGVKNSWTREQKIALCLLAQSTGDWTRIRRIFNRVFRQELGVRGFRAGKMPKRSLRGYFWDRHCRKSDEFRLVFDKDRDDGRNSEIFHLRQKLFAAGARWITVGEAHNGHDYRWQANKRCEISSGESDRPSLEYKMQDSRRLAPAMDQSVGQCSFSSSSYESPQESLQDDRSNDLWYDLLGSDSDPPILFRTFTPYSQGINDADEGFVAQAFARAKTSARAAPMHLQALLDASEPHLNLATIPEPGSHLISVTCSFIWALWKASQNADVAQIAFIDTRVAQRHTVLWKTSPLVKELKKQGRASFWYKGTHEYLAYGPVKPEALIATISMRGLAAFARQFEPLGALLELWTIKPQTPLKRTVFGRSAVDLNYALGAGIGAFARFVYPSVGLHSTFMADVVSIFFSSWLRCTTDWLEWRKRRVFVNGLNCGLCRATDLLHPMPKRSFLGVFVPRTSLEQAEFWKTSRELTYVSDSYDPTPEDALFDVAGPSNEQQSGNILPAPVTYTASVGLESAQTDSGAHLQSSTREPDIPAVNPAIDTDGVHGISNERFSRALTIESDASSEATLPLVGYPEPQPGHSLETYVQVNEDIWMWSPFAP
ncbi:MAG: hypothetical protein M1828_000434 [Chrysothrix sp. TS-e1954]|nr:MAG: hypothetical protein M1828_000434 [Chrysothrix sp. TS-e1954]